MEEDLRPSCNCDCQNDPYETRRWLHATTCPMFLALTPTKDLLETIDFAISGCNQDDCTICPAIAATVRELGRRLGVEVKSHLERAQ